MSRDKHARAARRTHTVTYSASFTRGETVPVRRTV